MVVLLTCKKEEDPTKNECARVLKGLYIDFSHTQGQLLRSPLWNHAEIQTHLSFYVCPSFMSERIRSIKNEVAGTLTISPNISLWHFFQTLKGS